MPREYRDNQQDRVVMRRLPLLLIGDTSEPWAVGSKLMRSAECLGLHVNKEIIASYNSPALQYSPSMKRLSGKIFYRMADRRSWEWWNYQKHLKMQIHSERPKLVLVTGILPLKKSIFKLIHDYNGRIVNYLTDDPWSRGNYRRCFIKNLKHYDHIFSTKEAIRSDLETAGVTSHSLLPQAYDPSIHHPSKRNYKSERVDVLFVGTGAKERSMWLDVLNDLPNLVRRIHGNSWEEMSHPGWEKRSAVTGEDYCNAIDNAEIVLGLLRKSSRDLATDRSYEIGAIGGCGLYQDSSEHRELLGNYPEEGFFSSPSQLRERVQHLMANPQLRKKLRDSGAKAIRKPENTYTSRLKAIIEWSNKVKN